MQFNNSPLKHPLTRFFFCLLLALLAVLSACGGGGGAGATGTTDEPTLSGLPPAPAVNNVLDITVDAGPPNTGYNVNRLYTTVTLCLPGSVTQCQTIDHVLVDTGSVGLRLLSSALVPGLDLPKVVTAEGLPLLNCIQFVDASFAWGPVVKADVRLGGKTAANTPIQLIADPAFSPLSATCATGRSLQTAQYLGAHGILGLGMQREDCGLACITRPLNGVYYTCTDSACTRAVGSRAALAQQVAQPVAKFDTDNNGLVVDLPAVNARYAASLSGRLIFGIGSQSNNVQAPATPVLTVAGNGSGITTHFAGSTFQTTYLDTGSNGIFFGTTGTMGACSAAIVGFYCPAALTALSATLTGSNGQTFPVAFSVDSAAELFKSRLPVLPLLAGDLPDLMAFDWGLPFFFGRRVYFGLEGVNGGGAYVAIEASQ